MFIVSSVKSVDYNCKYLSFRAVIFQDSYITDSEIADFYFRFTMLLLEPGEIFFEDYSVQMRRLDASSSKDKKWMDGRLKLCSKSLVFVNKDICKPLIKVQLKETISIEQCVSNDEVE